MICFFFWILLHAIQSEIEDVEIAQPSGFSEAPVCFVHRMRENEGYNLLAQSSMGSKTMTMESREVVLGPARANYRVGVTDCNKISLAIKRHLITASGTFAINNERNSRDCGSDVHDVRQFQSCAQVNPHERSERTVMLHERIGDRAD